MVLSVDGNHKNNKKFNVRIDYRAGERKRNENNIAEDKRLARWVRKHYIIGSTAMNKITQQKEVTL